MPPRYTSRFLAGAVVSKGRNGAASRAARLMLVALMSLGLAAPLAASELSERLYSRALVDLHAGRLPAAIRLLDQAVAADPGDPFALYYRGVARSRQGDRPGARADLAAALAVRPGLRQAAVELGVLLVEYGKYAEALPHLQPGAEAPAVAARAALFAGIAQLRLGRAAAAAASFEQAEGADPKVAPAARYYRGVAAFQARNWDAASAHFDHVVRASPHTEVGREAARYLARLATRQARPFRLHANLGFEYDSNVCLAPDGNGDCAAFDASSGREDGRTVFTMGGLYAPVIGESAHLALGYEFFQSLHFDLRAFDLQDHRPSVQFAFEHGPFRAGASGRYDYYLRDGNSFLEEGNIVPWVGVNQGGFGRAEAFFRVRRRDFKETALEARSGFNHAVGASQYFYLDSAERYLSVGYRFDVESPLLDQAAAQRFAYDGHEANAAFGWLWPADITTLAAYAFRHEGYDAASRDANVPNSASRRDREHRVTLVASIPIHGYLGIASYLAIDVGYYGHINRSNQSATFTYNRHIGSLALRAMY